MSFRFLMFLAVVSLAAFYALTRVGHISLKRKTWLKITAALLFAVAFTSQFAYRMGSLSLESPGFTALTWIGGTLLGFWGTFLILSLPIDAAFGLGNLAHRFARPKSYKKQKHAGRRDFLKRMIPASLIGASAGISALGLKQAMAGPLVKRVNVPIAGLPPELVGLTIAQISDLHIGPTIDRDYVEEVVTTVQSLDPAMIAVTGDLADGEPETLRERMSPLASLQATLGVYYVTGNHEYYWGGEQWVQACRESGFIPLINANQVMTHAGKKILIAGVTDTSAHQFVADHRTNPKAAAKTTEAVDLKILLAHRPDSCFAAEPEGFDLQLSGHTHAGQFFPWRLLMPLAHKYYEGLNRHGRMWVYVNSGTGYWGPPHRFSVPSEITLLTLSRA